jgi:glycosyltransferase involved in cell wall biosynthesis
VKIAQISPLCEAVPPRLYGGTERVVAHLCDALVEAGHDVTLFAAADARTRARLVPMRDQATRLDPDPNSCDLAAHLAMLHTVRAQADRFDLLHFHTDLVHFPLFEHCAERTLTTLHGRLDIKDLPGVLQAWPKFPLVSISDSQRRPLPQARWLGTVHHGLPQDQFRFGARPEGGYLAFLGRASPEKRLDRAIAIARAAGLPLKIAAKVDEVDRPYFERRIAPLLNQPGIDFIGEIGDQQKDRFLGDAVALLFPIDWPEPFGLAMIEALACGTPVIAWDCGAVPEVIDDGVTGRIVRSEAEAVAAVAEVASFDRLRIRDTFERRFSATAMADNYVELYWRLSQASELGLRRSA